MYPSFEHCGFYKRKRHGIGAGSAWTEHRSMLNMQALRFDAIDPSDYPRPSALRTFCVLFAVFGRTSSAISRRMKARCRSSRIDDAQT
jgi:hypothetical protein